MPLPRITAVLLACLTLPSVAFGQGGFGVIAGKVTDPNGGAIPQARIRVINTDNNLTTEITTDSDGGYLALQLQPGAYSLEAEAAGFKKLQRTGINLQISDRLTVDLRLEVGQVSETVNVTADAPLLRTQDAQAGEVITSRMIQNLPQLSRDPLQLLILSGNVQGSGSRAVPNSDTRINGGRTVGVEYLVDGITAGTGLAHDVVRTTPSMEAVREFKVITNGISAEYGRLSGGLVEVVTKSGGNQLHGQVFHYLRNDNLNANSWRQNAEGGKKVEFKDNIFGVVGGGPVRLPGLYNGTNKTFFFANYEGGRNRKAGVLQTASVPTELERRGDFSQTVFNNIRPTLYDQNGVVIFDAATNRYIRQDLLGDGKIIPANLISPVSQALLKFTPLPNRAPQAGTNNISNYAAPQNSLSNNDAWAVRLDHQVSGSQRVFGRFTMRDFTSSNTRWYGEFSPTGSSQIDNAFGLTLNYDWIKSPTLLFNFRAGGNYNPFVSGNLLPEGFSSADIPLDPINRALIGTDNIHAVVVNGRYVIANSASKQVTASTTYNAGGSMTKILGRHTLKIGYEHRRFYDNFWNAGGGVFRFIANPVHQIAGVDYGWTSDISNAYGMASFLIGVNSTAAANAPTTRAMNLNYHAAYIQHDIKVNSRLTLNLGLRWDMETPVTERNDKLYFWDPQAAAPFTINAGYNFNAAVIAAGLDPAQVRTPEWVANGFPKGAIRVANTPEFPSRHGNKYHPWQFAPRLGVAYRLNEKTVLRGSFAQTYLPTTGSAGAFSTGGSGVRLSDGADSGWHASNDNLVHMISSFAKPYQPSDFSKYERTTQAANFQSTGPTGPSAFNRDSHMPYELTWSMGIQRQLTSGLLVEGAYSGNHGEGLLGPDLIGRVPKEIFSGGPAGQNARTYTRAVGSPTAGQTLENAVIGIKQPLAVLESAYPYFGIMAVLGSNIGRSNYHAFNLRAEQRLSRGLSFLANYTLSKSLDDVGGPNQGTGLGLGPANLGGKSFQTVDPITVTYGLSPLDETHRFTGTFNYELPVGRGRRYMGSADNFFEKVADYVIGGWELAAIAVFRSGRPIVFDSATVNVNNNIRVQTTYPSFATSDTNLANPQFSQNNQILVSSRDPRTAGMVRRFDPTKVTTAQAFTYGTLPPIYGDIRHPGNRNYDLSLMKAFYFDPGGRRYLQFRMEARNVFNIRGFGPYNTRIGTSDFGLITSAGNEERNIQVSARIIF